jgi:hypothetical protein
MGLFQHRPEEPTEWGGLPAEPLDQDPVEKLLASSGWEAPLWGATSSGDTIAYTLQPADAPDGIDGGNGD